MTTIKKQIVAWIALAITALGLVFWSGCASWPRSYNDSRVGYFVAVYREAQSRGKLDPEAEADMQRYAGELANQRLSELTHGDDLPAMQEFVKQLEQPVVIDPAPVDNSTKLPVEWKVIRDWAMNNPSRCGFDGATVSISWAQSLQQARQRVAELTDQFARFMSNGQQQSSNGNYTAALQAYEAALTIDPSSAVATNQRRQTRVQWGTTEFNKLLPPVHAALDQARTLANAYHTDQSNEKLLTDCIALMDQAQGKLDDFRTWCQGNEDFTQTHRDKEAAIRKEEITLAALRGRTWGEKLWLLSKDNQFWDAYRFQTRTWETTSIPLAGGKSHHLESHEQEAFRSELRKAYEEMLPKSLAYFNRNAQLRASEGRLGLTLVLLCAGQELLDYHRAQNFSITADLQEQQRQLTFYLNDSREKLNKVSLNRRILLGEFKAHGDEGTDLSAKIFDHWIEKYSTTGPKDGPALFCGVTMEKTVTEPAELDYVIAGQITALFVDPLPPQELSASDVYIGREPERLTKDENSKKLNKPLYVQDILIFVKRVIQMSKKATLRATITVSHLGETSSLKSFTEEFAGSNRPLPGVTFVDNETIFSSPSSKTIRNVDQSALRSVEPLPQNIPVNLSTDRDIGQAALDYAADQTIEELQKKVTRFPLEHLVQQALQQQKLGKQDDAADYLGQCLEYCFQLTVADKAATPPTDWPATRQAIAAKVTEMNKTAWNGENQELKEVVGDIWNQSVRAALASLKP
jgi:tetratricopeptide (TPR) repeat protein